MIKTESEYKIALSAIDSLMDIVELGEDEKAVLDRLLSEVIEYETKPYDGFGG